LEPRTLVWPDGSEVTFAGEALQVMEDEAACRGLSLTQLWDEMLREFRNATNRELESS
jgi:hypothetical protein